MRKMSSRAILFIGGPWDGRIADVPPGKPAVNLQSIPPVTLAAGLPVVPVDIHPYKCDIHLFAGEHEDLWLAIPRDRTVRWALNRLVESYRTVRECMPDKLLNGEVLT